MANDDRQEALENISLIKELMTRSRQELFYSGGGWIAIIWGLFCFMGYAGQLLINLARLYEFSGLWWLVLMAVAFFFSALVIRRRAKTQSPKLKRYLIRGFLLFWIPLILLISTLCTFCFTLPDLPAKYMISFILLVVSTGYLILGLLFQKSLLFMGVIGFSGTVIVTLFFIENASFLLSILFGTGNVLTGLLLNRKG